MSLYRSNNEPSRRARLARAQRFVDQLAERAADAHDVWGDDDPYDEPDYMTDSQADREYREDADRAVDRYEKGLGL